MDDATRAISALLAPLTNWESTRADAPRFSLAAMRRLLARPGADRPAARLLIQVGGSKGKGTTAAYAEALARSAGMSTGVYASPHVSSIRERVRIDGAPVDGAEFVAAVKAVIDWLSASGSTASAFEVLTAAALDLFAAHDLDVGILEVGLGGRLDATTAVDVDASVLTSVELEHTEILGDSIEAIAREKVAILRPGRVAVSGVEEPARAIVRAHAESIDCRLIELGRELRATVIAGGAAERGSRVRLEDDRGEACELELRGAPAHELQALALAWAALRALGIDPRPSCLDRPTLPARFEVRIDADGEPLVLDGAHTARSALALAAAVRDRFPGAKASILYASARGKRWQEVLSPLLPIADSFAVTELSGTASEDPAAICAWLVGRAARARAVPDAAAGLAALRESRSLRIVTGSFYLAGAVRALLDPVG